MSQILILKILIYLRVWLPESKLRPFRKENESLYENTLNLLSNKYRRELEKAFKKAKKIAKNYDVPLNV